MIDLERKPGGAGRGLHARAVVLSVFAALALCLGVQAAQAAKQPKLQTVIKCDKSEKERVNPGQVLTYTITTTNQGDDAARNVEVTNPVPRQTVCIPSSAKGKDCRVLFSIDGGGSYAAWPIRELDPKTKKQKEVDPSRITHVKWVLRNSLPPGRDLVVSYQVRVK